MDAVLLQREEIGTGLRLVSCVELYMVVSDSAYSFDFVLGHVGLEVEEDGVSDGHFEVSGLEYSW